MALLAASRDQVLSRDKLVGYLWPESAEERARHSLSDTLHVLNRELGSEAVQASGELLRLNVEVVWTDVRQLEEDLERGEPGAAVEAYGGPFLDGFYVSEAPELERWVESERERYAGLYARALEALALEAEDAGDYGQAAGWWKRLAAQDPYDSRLVVRVMEALAAAGDVANALQHAHVHEVLLREELGVEPSAEVLETAERLKAEAALARTRPAEGREGAVAEVLVVPTPVEGERPRRWRKLALAAVGTVVLVGVVVGGWLLLGRGEPDEPAPVMVVVLPFENLGASEDEYLAHGITDALNVNLTGIHDLGVISRTSAYAVQGSGKTAGEIGSELGVQYILEGTVQRERPGDLTSRVRINPQLIRVADDMHLWAESYDVQVSEIFNVYSDIVGSVARALEITLLEEERLALQERPTENIQAYDYFLRAQEYIGPPWQNWHVRARLFERAIELDPDFALAYAQLAAVYFYFYSDSYSTEDATQASLRAGKAALDRALELDPQHRWTRLALAMYYYRGLGDWDRALEVLLAMEEDFAGRDRWLGITQRRRGELEEAVRYLERAVGSDPLNHASWTNLGTTSMSLHRYPEAERCFDRAIAARPDNATSYEWKGWLYLIWSGDTERARETSELACAMRGERMPCGARDFLARAKYRILREHYEEEVLEGEVFPPLVKGLAYQLAGDVERSRAYHDTARAEWAERVANHPRRSNFHRGLAYAYLGLGRAAEAVQEAEAAVRLLGTSFTSRDERTAALAEVYVSVGEYDMALDQIEWSLSNPGMYITPMELRLDPLWDPIREHPRFQALLEEHN